MSPYLQMALNTAWANRTLYDTVSAMSPDAFSAPRPGFFPSIAATLNHILEVDLYYLDALEAGGLGRSVFDRAPLVDAAALAGAQAEADLRLARFCQGLTEAMCRETRETERADGVVTERVEALLLHLLQHQVHHRGQVHTQLSHAGIAPPQLDEFFLEYERAETAQAYWP